MQTPPLPRAVIWIVDDSPDDPALVERTLGAMYDCERFSDVSILLDRLAEGARQPDLILVERVTRGRTGDELCRLVRADPRTRTLPIILITASRIETAEVTDAFASGANDYVSRPFAVEELRARVDSAVRVRSAERAVELERERIARFQQEMFAIVGHDLRGPLEAILIGTEMLAADLATNPSATYVVTRIESSVKRMSMMIDELLDVTRARLGTGIGLARRPTDLAALVSASIEELALAHPQSRFELVGTSIEGTWDPDKLGQVVTNLVRNAIHYGRKGAPIAVGLARHHGIATITVHNELQGEPIAPEVLAAFFDPYRRGNHAHNARGLGLGLYLVREIVHAHGGTVNAESTASGTTFRVVVPDALHAADQSGVGDGGGSPLLASPLGSPLVSAVSAL